MSAVAVRGRRARPTILVPAMGETKPSDAEQGDGARSARRDATGFASHDASPTSPIGSRPGPDVASPRTPPDDASGRAPDDEAGASLADAPGPAVADALGPALADAPGLVREDASDTALDDLDDQARFAHVVAVGGVFDGRGARLDADLVRAFCVHRSDEVDPRGIRLRDVHLTGQLDLTGVQVPFALRFENCRFDEAPILLGARVRELAFIDCAELPGLIANGISVQGDLVLSGCRIVGCHRTSASLSRRAAVWLCESSIGGRLLSVDTVIEPLGERAVQADRLRVGGTVRIINLVAAGELRLVGLQVDGSLDLTGARVETASGLALDLGDAAIAGNMYVAPAEMGRRPEFRGRINLSSTRIDGTLLIRDATLVRPDRDEGRYHSPRFDGKALVGLRLFVGAELSIEGTTTVTGGVDLSSAELGRFALGPAGRIEAPGQAALDLTNADIRSDVSIDDGIQIRGAILLVSARIHGRLVLTGVTLTDAAGHSLLKAEGAAIDGDVDLRRLRATGGQLKFWRCTIGGGFDAAGAVVENPTGGTVRLHQSEVRGSVRLTDGFSSLGCVVLSRSLVGGRLDLDGGRFHCPAATDFNQEQAAIRAVSATFSGGMDLGWEHISPAINVTDVTTTVVQDDPRTWPERSYIAGFTYERFDAVRGAAAGRRIWDWRERLAWLRKQPEYDAGPYEQAARVFRQHGYAQAAEQLLIEQRSDARRAEKSRAPLRNLLDWVYGWTVGYGYRPGRVLWLLVALLVLVSASLMVPGVQQTIRASDEGVVFTVDGPLNPEDVEDYVDPCGGGRVRCFNPVLYAVDTVIPLIALDQRSTWYPDHFVPGGVIIEWYLNLSTVAGWLLSSVFLLSFARLARNT